MISVVMPVLNEERLVGRAIRSILAQSFGDLELVVVDNGSSDRSLEIVAGFAAADPRVRLVEEPMPGTAGARNRGLREARRPWVAVQDADDVSHPERLERLIEHVKRRPRTVVVGSWAVCYSEATGLREPFYHATSDFAVRCQLRTGPAPFVHTTVLMRRDACLEVGGYPLGYFGADDYALWGALQGRGRMENLPMHLGVYRHQDREIGSAFRVKEQAAIEALKRRYFRPATRWDEWLLRLGAASRRGRALKRIAIDWPPELIGRLGLENAFRRGGAAAPAA